MFLWFVYTRQKPYFLWFLPHGKNLVFMVRVYAAKNIYNIYFFAVHSRYVTLGR